MSAVDLGNLPVFLKDTKAAVVKVLKPGEMAVWDLGSGKIFAVEFEVAVEITENDSAEELAEKLYAPINKTLNLFPMKDHLYLTTRDEFWQRFTVEPVASLPEGANAEDAAEALKAPQKHLYTATISATYMNVTRAMGSDGSLESKA